MPLSIDGIWRCDWVLENNGIVKSLWVTQSKHGPIYARIETPKENGVPEVGDFLSLTGKSGHNKQADASE